jgi:ABC-type transport system involved in multi-copper enzyme maturation permease subunit
MQIITTLTWLTFHEARRRRMVVAALLLGGLFVGLYWLGLRAIVNEMNNDDVSFLVRQGAYNFLVVAALYVVHFLTVMLSIFASVDAISGEIATHTIHTIATRPIRRWQIVLGKWLGYVLMVTLYLVLLCGSIFAVSWFAAGYLPPNPIAAVGLLILEAIVLLSLSLLLGTQFSTLTNGVVLFMLYGLAFVGAWVEQIGAFLQSSAAIRIGIITSLLMPVESLWRRAAYLMQPPLANAMPNPFSSASLPSTAMVIYAGGYALLALLLALRVFGRRDL